VAQLIYSDRTAIFKFNESGLGDAIVEAADFIRESNRRGRVLDSTKVTIHQNDDGIFINFPNDAWSE